MPISHYVPSRIESLTRVLMVHGKAPVGGPRDALTKAVRGECALAIAASHEHYTILVQSWDWLAAHRDHPRFREREETFVARVAEYIAIEQAIADAEERLGIESQRTRGRADQREWRAAHNVAPF